MAVVVTGAAGFVGSLVVETLLARGDRVVGVDRHLLQPRQDLVTLTDLIMLRADLLDGDAMVCAALADADAVVHLAGCPGVRDPRPDVDWRRHRDNVLATAAVLAAVPLTTPLVIASSSSVYGGSRGRACRESDPLRPRGGYAASKARVEALCRQQLADGGRVALARPFTVVGEGQRPDMALAQWIDAARSDRPLRLLGSAERTRDVTDVRQAALALIALADRGVSGPVNIGTGRARRLGELVAAVARAVDRPIRVYVEPAARDDVPSTLADTRRLRALTGLELHTDLDDVVARAAASAVASTHAAVLQGTP